MLVDKQSKPRIWKWKKEWRKHGQMFPYIEKAARALEPSANPSNDASKVADTGRANAGVFYK